MTISKSDLWNMLVSIEKKASEAASEKTGVLIVSEPQGHIALEFLNRALGKKPNTKLRRYNESQLKQALETIKSPLFMKQLVDHFAKEGNDPETQLSVLRAQRLTDPSVTIPRELVEKVKSKKPDKIRLLWDKLESLGIEVCELVDEGKGLVGFKIRTPLHTYLSIGYPEQIIKVARKDIKLYNSARCKLCKNPINYMERDGYGVGCCSQCGSLWGSIPESLGKFVSERLFKEYSYDGIITALRNWDLVYLYDDRTDYSWFLYARLKEIGIEAVTEKVKIIPPEITSTQLRVPVFILEDDPEDGSVYPDCRMCRYALEYEDASHYIIGVDTSFGPWDEYLCVYPMLPEDVVAILGFQIEIKPTRMRGYQDFDEGLVWNPLVERVLELFPQVSMDESLEGKSRTGFIHPICPRFELNRDHPDLAENGGDLVESGEEVIAFGVVNYKRIEREKELKKVRELSQRLSRLSSENLIPRKRIECNQLFEQNSGRLIDFLVRNLSAFDLKLLLKYPDTFKPFFNTSHKAYGKIIRSALKNIAGENKQNP